MIGLLAGLLLLTASFAAPQDNATPGLSGSKVQCAMLVYAGNKSSYCFSDQFLQRMQTETKIQTETHFRKVRLDSRDLTNYPFAILTGEGSFRLTDKERTQLRYYLTHGGFLLVSAGCSNEEWARSFRAEFAHLFPGKPLTPLKRSHPLFDILYKIDTLATIHGTHGLNGTTLESFAYKGKTVLLFSPDGLNDTEHAQNCCCCGGDELSRAEFLNINALAYALLR